MLILLAEGKVISQQPLVAVPISVATPNHTLARAGQAANQAAARIAFEEYRGNRPAQTLPAQQTDLANFVSFLAETGIHASSAEELAGDRAAWQGVTHALVLTYREWLMGKGYAIAIVNRRLATVKVYARMALPIDTTSAEGQQAKHETGATASAAVTNGEIEKIKGVRGFGHKQGRNRDAKRKEKGTPTRVGAKKPYKAVTLNAAQAKALKNRPPTPLGRRDALLLCLLLDHGLRCGEVAMPPPAGPSCAAAAKMDASPNPA